MSIPTIKPEVSLAFVLEETTHTSAVLAARPFTKALAADFDAIALVWAKVNEQEIQHRIGLVRANALVDAADDELDELVDATSHAVLLTVKGDRGAPQYRLYFSERTPGDLKRPVLSKQLEIMRKWVPSLVASGNAVLKDLGARLESAVAVADQAVATLAVAEQGNREFRTVGARRAFIDSVNALRKSTYGKLAEMPHAEPSRHLPVTFAKGFFRHQVRKTAGKPTAAELAEQLGELETQAVALKEQIADATAEEEAAAKARSDAGAHDAAIAEAEREAEAAAAKVAALKAKKK